MSEYSEDRMLVDLRALGVDPEMRRALVGLAAVGLTVEQARRLTQDLATGRLRLGDAPQDAP